MIWNQGQVVGGAVNFVSHHESKFLFLAQFRLPPLPPQSITSG
jgi:hypothetical protein